jgi:hypothetical protein
MSRFRSAGAAPRHQRHHQQHDQAASGTEGGGPDTLLRELRRRHVERRRAREPDRGAYQNQDKPAEVRLVTSGRAGPLAPGSASASQLAQPARDA